MFPFLFAILVFHASLSLPAGDWRAYATLSVKNNLFDEFVCYKNIKTGYFPSHSCAEQPQTPVAVITAPAPQNYNLITAEDGMIAIKGSALRSGDSALHKFYVEYASREFPNKWRSQGVILANSGTSYVSEDILARIDLSAMDNGYYFIRLTVYSEEGGKASAITGVSIDREIMAGWPQAQYTHFYSSPTVADLDPDYNGLEVIAASNSGELYAWHSDGSVVAGWPKRIGTAVSTPAVADVDGDGSLEIFIACFQGMVHAFHQDGRGVAGWPQYTAGNFEWSTVALADINGDNDLEVVVGSTSAQIFAWHHNGQSVSGWPVKVTAQIQASPAIGDLDGDGLAEIVISAKDGYIHVLQGDGQRMLGWPQQVTTTGRSTASAVLGDLDGDGDLEIVVGLEDNNDVQQFKIFAWHHSGSLVRGWPQFANWLAIRPSSAALADLDKDGDLEVIVMSGDNRIHVWSGDGVSIGGWPPIETGFDGFEYMPSSPVIADIDGDEYLEVIVEEAGHQIGELWLYDIHAFNHDASAVIGWPKTISGYSNSTPTVADIDFDGDVEVILGADGVFVWDLPGAYSARSVEWPVYRYNNRRTGSYGTQ